MKWVIRIVLGLLAIPALIFAAGFFGVLFGILEAPEQVEVEPEAAPEVVAEATPYRKPIDAAELSGDSAVDAELRKASQGFDFTPFPEAVDDRSALEWMAQNKLMVTANDGVELDPARFSTLTAEQSLALLWAFKTPQNAATGDRRKQLQILGGLVFMGAAYMPQVQRLAFAQDAQSVAWPGSGVDRYRSGEFVLMFYMKGAPYQMRAEAALRRFAPMLPGSAILSALDRVNAINVRKGDADLWEYNMEPIRHLSPETLQVLHDFMGPADSFSNDDLREFSYAKDRVQDLIEERRTETDQ